MAILRIVTLEPFIGQHGQIKEVNVAISIQVRFNTEAALPHSVTRQRFVSEVYKGREVTIWVVWIIALGEI